MVLGKFLISLKPQCTHLESEDNITSLGAGEDYVKWKLSIVQNTLNTQLKLAVNFSPIISTFIILIFSMTLSPQIFPIKKNKHYHPHFAD